MMKERMMAIVIGALMLFSVAGFALMGLGRFADSGNQPVEVPNVIEAYLSGAEVSQILRSQRVLIRDVYTKNCTQCPINDATLEMFVNSVAGNVVLEKVMIEPDNTTTVDENGYVKFEMISATGDIVELSGKELDQENLMDMFCDISLIQPKQCLLRDIVSGDDDVTEATGDEGNTTDIVTDNSTGMDMNNTGMMNGTENQTNNSSN